MEFCWALPVSNVNECTMQAIQAEVSGFDSILIASAKQAPDPWIMTMLLATYTSRVRFLVAQNTNLLQPHITMKALNSVSQIYGNRCDINIVTGGIQQEALSTADFASHEDRYLRTKEFVKCVHLLKGGAASYKGSVFNYNQLTIEPPYTRDARVFIAGSSDEALNIAAAQGDVLICYADTVGNFREKASVLKQKALLMGRSLKLGMYVDILAAENTAEAVQIANRKFEMYTDAQQKMIKMYLNSVDSVGIRKNKQYAECDKLWVEDHLWAGLSKVSRSVGLTVIGSYEEVCRKLEHYHSAGVDYFLFSGYLDAGVCKVIGEHIIPYFKTSIKDREPH
ncbi:LLM class flavin-dependent oxidoreductase [Paenibacillus hubeiensis]|uniref:LLM class flavin-dependent oxidoreductase n=1 Tax=Paenibacillus hubeiensis TaxID=3077330 RepID=UPI0031BADC4E